MKENESLKNIAILCGVDFGAFMEGVEDAVGGEEVFWQINSSKQHEGGEQEFRVKRVKKVGEYLRDFGFSTPKSEEADIADEDVDKIK